jgi:hypothetical protein
MCALELGELIRSERDNIKTPNIYEYLGQEEVEVHFDNFRNNKQDKELVLFFFFEGTLYFPVWFEFRSINNNLLFLFFEYEIDSFSNLVSILNSSLEKEERYTAAFKALIYQTKKLPSFSIPLPDFKIEKHESIEIEES